MRYKVYLADAAIASAGQLKRKGLIENSAAFGVATGTAVFKRLAMHYYYLNSHVSYWRDKRGHEVDLVAEVEGAVALFEATYRA